LNAIPLFFEAVIAGAFWGAVVAGIYRWMRRGIPKQDQHTWQWFAGTWLLIAVGFWLVHSK